LASNITGHTEKYKHLNEEVQSIGNLEEVLADESIPEDMKHSLRLEFFNQGDLCLTNPTGYRRVKFNREFEHITNKINVEIF
jgi:hypothetical protein